LVWTCSRLGGVLSPFLFAWTVLAFGTWIPWMWVLAGLGGIWCVLFWLWFRNRPEEMPAVNEAEPQGIAAGRAPRDLRRLPIPWAAMLRSRSVWGLCLMYGFTGIAGNFNTNLSPIYLRGHRQLSPEVAKWLFGLPLACGVIACVFGSYLSD